MTKATMKSGSNWTGPYTSSGRFAAWAAAMALGVLSSSAAAEGVALTFGVGLRTQSDSNLTLAPTSPGATTQTKLNLSFGLTSATAQSTLALRANAGFVLAASGPGHVAMGLATPNLTLNYARTAANAEFTLDGSLSKAEIATDPNVTDFATGSGQRQTATLSTGLTFGKADPLGFGVNAKVTGVAFQGTSDPRLIDHRTTDLGATARADISAVLHLNIGLTFSRFSQSGFSGARNTTGLSLGATLDRPTGVLNVSLTRDSTPEGNRDTLDWSQQLALAAGKLLYNFGGSRGISGKTYATGGLTYAQDLVHGAIDIALTRVVQANADTNAETLVSSAGLGYRDAITPQGNLGLSLNWASQRDTATNATIANTSLSATWTQSLPQDWALDMGYTKRLRDQDLVGKGQSDSLFLTLHRDFSIRY